MENTNYLMIQSFVAFRSSTLANHWLVIDAWATLHNLMKKKKISSRAPTNWQVCQERCLFPSSLKPRSVHSVYDKNNKNICPRLIVDAINCVIDVQCYTIYSCMVKNMCACYWTRDQLLFSIFDGHSLTELLCTLLNHGKPINLKEINGFNSLTVPFKQNSHKNSRNQILIFGLTQSLHFYLWQEKCSNYNISQPLI